MSKRAKLTDEQREQIRATYKGGVVSQRELAEEYGVSRRTIQFVLDPEKYERQKDITRANQIRYRAEGRYYDRDKQREYYRDIRARKRQLMESMNGG
jgi:DNA-binding XRE family transcriptional regulator